MHTYTHSEEMFSLFKKGLPHEVEQSDRFWSSQFIWLLQWQQWGTAGAVHKDVRVWQCYMDWWYLRRLHQLGGRGACFSSQQLGNLLFDFGRWSVENGAGIQCSEALCLQGQFKLRLECLQKYLCDVGVLWVIGTLDFMVHQEAWKYWTCST